MNGIAHSPKPKRLLGSLLPGHCSAPAKRSENSTLGIDRYALHCTALPTFPVPNGLTGYICAPRRRYIGPTPVQGDAAHIRCHRPDLAPLLDLRPPTLPRATQAQNTPDTSSRVPTARAGITACAMARGSWAMLCILRRPLNRLLPVPRCHGWPLICVTCCPHPVLVLVPALRHVVNPNLASECGGGGTTTPTSTSALSRPP